MIQRTRSTIRRSASIVMGAVLTGALFGGGVAAQDGGVAPPIDEPPAGTDLAGDPQAAPASAETLSRYDEITANLYSDHLREIALDWGLEGTPSTGSVDPSLLYSGYLRELSADW